MNTLTAEKVESIRLDFSQILSNNVSHFVFLIGKNHSLGSCMVSLRCAELVLGCDRSHPIIRKNVKIIKFAFDKGPIQYSDTRYLNILIPCVWLANQS